MNLKSTMNYRLFFIDLYFNVMCVSFFFLSIKVETGKLIEFTIQAVSRPYYSQPLLKTILDVIPGNSDNVPDIMNCKTYIRNNKNGQSYRLISNLEIDFKQN